MDELSFSSVPGEGNVQVVCRFRPISESERRLKAGSCVSFSADQRSVTVSSSHNPPFTAKFDRVFSEGASQESVYSATGEPLIAAVLEGFNSTILTYGQTGSGKTFTMTGAIDDPQMKGVIPRMVSAIFEKIEVASDAIEFTMKVGYCEIYMERIKDLLDPLKSNLKIHEDRSRGVFISNLTEQYVTDEDEVYELMRIGTENREVSATLMNEGSSRSHSIFIMTLAQSNTLDFSAKTSKLYLVDLAGSEKVAKTGAEGRRLDEAKLINKSLSTLGMVIYSLTDSKSTHVPYRDSKITRVLQDSLGGNSKTTLITTCSPSSFNLEETISTLRFGVRAKAIHNQPKVNKELTLAELKIMLLKAESESQRKEKRIECLEKLLLMHGIEAEEGESARMYTQEEPEGEDRDLALHPEIERMQGVIDELQARLSEEISANSQLRNESKDSHERALMSEHEAIKLTAQVMELKAENEKVREELQEKEDWMRQLNATRDTLNTELARVMTAKCELDGKFKSLQEDMERSAAESARTDRVGSFLRANPRLTEELELKDAQIRELTARLEAREMLLAQIRDKTSDKSVVLLIRNSERDHGESMENTKELLRKAQEQVRRLSEELNQTKGAAERLFKAKIPNFEDVRKHIYQEAVGNAKKEWDEERAQLCLDLQNRVEKVIRLEIEIDEAHESYRTLEDSIRGGDSAMAQKVATLEKALDSLNINYHSLISQGSHLKVENEVLNNRVHRKTERIKAVEGELATAKEKITQISAEVEALRNDIEEMKTRGYYARSSMSFTASKLKRPIKGGNRLQAYCTHEIEETSPSD